MGRRLLVDRVRRPTATVFTSNAECAAALAPWLESHNTGRRHSALGGLPPISRLEPT
jgi:transposase InsO family protein